MTSYAVQGATFAESSSRIDENASRAETYVDITRGRSANHLYVTRSIDPLDGERLPKAPPPPITATVAAQLSSSGPERAAVDVDPGAPCAAVARTGLDLAGLHASIVAGAQSESVAPAAELRARQVARLGARLLDLSILDRLPQRGHVPYLGRQWDGAVANLAVFLARWNVTPGGDGRWQWALGPRGDQDGLNQERRQVAERLIDVTVAAAQETALSNGYELPRWARAHLASQAAVGKCVHDPDELRSLYERIGAYRRTAGVTSPEHPKNPEDAIFGPPPEDAVLRMKRRALVDEALPRDTTMTRPGPSRASL